MRYVIDIDGTICTPGKGSGNLQYENATPKKDRIAAINDLYDEGNYIIYFTARAMGRSSDKPYEEAREIAHKLLYPLTKEQLSTWGCKYHELIMGKPHADMFIDDKAWPDHVFFSDKK
jgi:hypothetical protein|tara:strand:+ start:186 stop:539 length:354 start_codon:yes stop_codon:yes gene_type:complete